MLPDALKLLTLKEQVKEARAANREVNPLPERTDMTEEQVKELLEKPADEVIEATKEELSDYSDDLTTFGLGSTIDKINDEIRESQELESDIIPVSTNTNRGNRSRKNK